MPTTILKHVALTYSSQARADAFLLEVLGLEPQEPKTLPASLARGLFGVDADIPMRNYHRGDTHFEIFIHPEIRPGASFDHVCVAVDDLQAFLERCRRQDFTITEVPKGDKVITFVSDDDGHRFEIKGA